GVVQKGSISGYLSFFPVTIGMVKGLRSPDVLQLDLMHTYNASENQLFSKLRWPSSMPFLFTSLKVSIAISLVGAIVGELPTGATAGLVLWPDNPDLVGAPDGSIVGSGDGLRHRRHRALYSEADGSAMIAGKKDIQRLLAPALFGVGVLLVWQMVVVGFDIPRILLPAPTEIGHQLVAQAGILWEDFQPTFSQSVLPAFP